MATEEQNSINYMAADFDSIKQELIDKLRETESWKDLYEGGIGMTLIELFSYAADMLSFYINMMANETYLDTAKLKSSVISLCKMIRYKLTLPSSATCDVKFTLDSTHTTDITIPQYTKISRFDDNLGEYIYYLTDEDLLISSGELVGTVGATQGERSASLTIGTSNGTSNQKFPLGVTNIAAGTVLIKIDGNAWEEAEFLIDYGPDDEVYKIDWEPDEELYVTFGDNRIGKIPEDGSVITLEYTITDEDYGNTGTNTIDTIVDTILDDLDADVTDKFSITNITEATGGGPTESTEHAKLYAPKISRAAERAVVIEDYEGLIGHLAPIAKVKCIDRKEIELVPFRQVWIYATPKVGDWPYPFDDLILTTTHKRQIDELLQQKALAGTDWLIKETDFVPINITMRFYYSNPNYSNTAEIQIRDKLIEYFDVENEERIYGENIIRNDLIVEILNLTQVALIELTTPSDDIQLTYNQYPILGTVTLINGGLV